MIEGIYTILGIVNRYGRFDAYGFYMSRDFAIFFAEDI